MNHLETICAAALLTFLAPSSAAQEDAPTSRAHESANWHEDFDEAVVQAKREGKDLLVDFTGSDWCGWCIRLHEEVFEHEEFLASATKNYVLVALDFPKAQHLKDKVPNPERNQELQLQHQVEGFPTILLMTADGEVFGRTGYQPGGAAPYLTHLDGLATKGKEQLAIARDLLAKAERASGKARVDLVQEAANALAKMTKDSPGVRSIAKLALEGIDLDTDNESGLKMACVEALVAAGQIDDKVMTATDELDPKNEAGLLERVIAAKNSSVASEADLAAAIERIRRLEGLTIHDDKLAMQVFANGAHWCARFLKDHETAARFAKKALALDPPERVKQMLEGIVDQ